jgi:hypothetical protein
MVWNRSANQPAATIVGVQNAHLLNVSGFNEVVTDIDTGVDPNHPVLEGVLISWLRLHPERGRRFRAERLDPVRLSCLSAYPLHHF